MKIFNHVFEIDLISRQPITHIRLHRHNYYTHLVWWKLSILWGQPHLAPVLVHKGCNGLIQRIGEDLIDYCEDCESIVEGDTHEITTEEFERGA